MTMEELNSLEDLLDLQLVDSDIDRLLDQRHSLPELAAYREADAEVQRIGAELATDDATLRETSLALDKSEGELSMLQEKRTIDERRLFAGGLGARETVALREAVEQDQRQVTALEDEILVLMEQRETQDAGVTGLRDEIAAIEEEKSRLEALVTEAWKGIDATIGRKEARKAEIVPSISEDLLELYEELREVKEGVAAARFAEGICGGCHLRLSAAEAAQALKASPPRCIHCHRILVPQ